MLDQDLRRAETYFFKALGDETRLRILELLKEHVELSVSDLCKEIEKEQGTISHHLACLRNCGLVTTQKQGKSIIYSINGKEKIQNILEIADRHVRDTIEGILRCEVVR